MNSFKEIARNQFTTSEEFIDTLKLRYKAICDLNRDLPAYYPLQIMLSELAKVPELAGFIIVKDNELNAVCKARRWKQELGLATSLDTRVIMAISIGSMILKRRRSRGTETLYSRNKSMAFHTIMIEKSSSVVKPLMVLYKL
jgi:hypothetical protein